MSERNPNRSAGQPSDKHELERAANEQHEKIRKNIENKAERRGESGHESAHESRERAHELAHEAERHHHESDRPTAEKAEHVPEINTKAKRQEAYDHTMTEMRSHLSPAGRTFSTIIHNPVVERVSDVTGKTIARPNAILAGSATAFFVVLGVFLVTRHYGYPLSGSETILAFALGWVLGLVFDYLRVMMTGRQA